jgi:hypothetical protein
MIFFKKNFFPALELELGTSRTDLVSRGIKADIDIHKNSGGIEHGCF